MRHTVRRVKVSRVSFVAVSTGRVTAISSGPMVGGAVRHAWSTTVPPLRHARDTPFHNKMRRLSGGAVLSTMTTPDKVYRWWFRDPLTKMILKGTFGTIGVKNLTRVNYADVTARGPNRRGAMLRRTERRFATLH